MKESIGYQRGLKSRHISLIALGGIIGSSYFLGTGYIFHEIGPSIFLAYVLGGLITYLTMSCLAELTVSVPAHGSFVTYVDQFISPSFACGVGWAYWVGWVVYVPSECLAAGIIMHAYVPYLPTYAWTLIFGAVVTMINCLHVKHFGEIEFWLSLVKIGLLICFTLLALGTYFGWIGTPEPFLGTKYLFDNGGVFPNGYAIFFISMVVIMTNFQGSEIIGLSASESQDPHIAVPSALKKISYRICGFYLLPTLLLALLFPWQDAGLSGSIFATVLLKYGFAPVAHVFSFLIIAGAISCANSGLYATIRSLHALAARGMAPSFLQKINHNGLPVRAAVFTLGVGWLMLLAACFFPSHKLYVNLLAISGFTCAFCWISICWAQLRFRKSSKKSNTAIGYKMPGFPFLTHVAIWTQVGFLIVIAWSPSLNMAFFLGLPAIVLPMLLHRFKKKTV